MHSRSFIDDCTTHGKAENIAKVLDIIVETLPEIVVDTMNENKLDEMLQRENFQLLKQRWYGLKQRKIAAL